MYKLKELEIEIFDDYVRNHKQKSHFLQSAAWGKLAKAKKNLHPYYMGLVNENNDIVGATLLLQKKLPLNLSYFYAPRGYVIDFHNKDLLKTMTDQVIKFIKNKKGIFLKIDPDLVIDSHNYEGKENIPEYNRDEILKNMKHCGFKHLGFTKNFETSQPRYTFRIDLNKNEKEIENHFSKTTKQRINKAIKLNTKVEIGTRNDLETFYHLMMLTESRKGFVSYNLDYYETLYDLFNEKDKATLFIGKVDIDEIIDIYNKDLEEITNNINKIDSENIGKSAQNKLKELEKRKENLEQYINKYVEIKEKFGNEIILNAHMIVEYGNKAWVLYAGNHNILMETYSNYHTYYKHLKFCYDRKLDIYDQFGTIGDLNAGNSKLGLHEFKKKFGGDYIEFIGEFDYIINPIWYFAFNKLIPFYRNIIKRKSQKKLQEKINNKND